MTKIQLETNPSVGQVAPPISRPAAAALNFDEAQPTVGGSINSVRTEVDDAFADMKSFLNREPDEMMRISAGHSARLSELRVKIMRIEDYRPEWRGVRMRDIEPCLEELQRQFTVASRLHSVRELDWRMESGER